MRILTLDEMMSRMGFHPEDTGPNVTELRKVVARQMEAGMIDYSSGTWAHGHHTQEDRAAALLEVHAAIERGDFEELDFEDSYRPVS